MVGITCKGFIASLVIPSGVDTWVKLIENVGIMWASISTTAVIFSGAKMVTIGGFFLLGKSVSGNRYQGSILGLTDCCIRQP
jgi:hypothetical protein